MLGNAPLRKWLKGLRRGAVAALLTVGFVGCGENRTGGQKAAVEEPAKLDLYASIQRDVQALHQKAASAIVRIESVDNHGKLSGTGFFVDPNGTLYTSYTVGGESRDLVVCHGDVKYPATLVVADARSGIAILKVDAPTPFLPLGKSGELKVASPVLVLGYPMDLPLTPSFGMVGGFDLKYLGSYFATTHIRANVAVQRGEGGAPLLNMQGEVVGVLISSLDQGSASHALPIEAAEKVRRDAVRYGEVRPGWIGVDVREGTVATADSSALVHSVMAGGPAEKAGVHAGDLLLEVGERTIRTPEDVLDASFFMTADETLPVRVLRGGKELALGVEAGDAPDRPRRKVLAAPNGDLRAEVPMRLGD